MKLSEAVLSKVAEWRPTELSTLAVTEAGWTLSLASDRCDELGCRVWQANLRRATELAERGAETLTRWANAVASRVTGLLEPLRVVEVDATRDEALLRSKEPTQRGERLFYYEVLLHGRGEATVSRYQGSHEPGAKREQVAFAMTQEALAKLCGDITAE